MDKHDFFDNNPLVSQAVVLISWGVCRLVGQAAWGGGELFVHTCSTRRQHCHRSIPCTQ